MPAAAAQLSPTQLAGGNPRTLYTPRHGKGKLLTPWTRETARIASARGNQARKQKLVVVLGDSEPKPGPDYLRMQIGILKGHVRRIDVALQRTKVPKTICELIKARAEACKMLEKITSTPPAPAIVNAPTLLEPQATVASPTPQPVVVNPIPEEAAKEDKPASESGTTG